jgi:SPW repeat
MNDASTTSPYTNSGIGGATVLNIILGIWLIISTFVLMVFNNLPSARWNNVMVGILVVLFGLARAARSASVAWSWLNLILGVWLIISPFALGFSNVQGGMLHNVIVGVIVGLLALSRSFAAHLPHVSPTVG